MSFQAITQVFIARDPGYGCTFTVGFPSADKNAGLPSPVSLIYYCPSPYVEPPAVLLGAVITLTDPLNCNHSRPLPKSPIRSQSRSTTSSRGISCASRGHKPLCYVSLTIWGYNDVSLLACFCVMCCICGLVRESRDQGISSIPRQSCDAVLPGQLEIGFAWMTGMTAKSFQQLARTSSLPSQVSVNGKY